MSLIIYINGLPKDLDFKGEGEKLKIPEKNVLIFGLLLFVIFGSNGIIIDWSALWFTKELNAPLYLASLGLICLIFSWLSFIFASTSLAFSNILLKSFIFVFIYFKF